MSDAAWRNAATEPVLRILYQSGVALSPGAVAANLRVRMDDPPADETVAEALEGLHDRGLARRLVGDEPYLVLTDEGRDVVETEVDQEAFGFH